VLTPKQSDAVASSLTMGKEGNGNQMLRCPACGELSISPKARARLLWHIQCPACKSYLRLKWGRLLLFGYFAAVALLVVGTFVKIPGFHGFPGAIVIIWSVCLALLFQAINRRLTLEPER
jgi:predicted RNA-binding Zn-ribbon protein involved in translation (DUF1610 family)